jgi:LysR family transcriptional activator of nhaA
VADEWLNYHHLLYFWTVAREGSVTRAAEVLDLTQPTVSTQVAALEKHFGQPLLKRTGRAVALTEAGQVVFDYAEDIFRLGRELDRVMRVGPTRGRSPRVVVGVADVLPKLVVYRLLEPVYAMGEPVQLEVVEDKTDRLLADLALHKLDLVLTDTQVGATGVKVRAYNHLLGESGVAVLAAPPLAARLRKGFPESLAGAPFLLPSDGTALRRQLDQWFADRRLRPDVRGEFADTALLKVFGQAGVGAFVVPTAIAAEAGRQYAAEVVGRLDGITERYYAVTVERRLRHPAVVKISEMARQELFSQAKGDPAGM